MTAREERLLSASLDLLGDTQPLGRIWKGVEDLGTMVIISHPDVTLLQLQKAVVAYKEEAIESTITND